MATRANSVHNVSGASPVTLAFMVSLISNQTKLLVFFSDLTGNLFTTIDVAAYGQLERLVLDLNKNIEAQLGLALPKSLREL